MGVVAWCAFTNRNVGCFFSRHLPIRSGHTIERAFDSIAINFIFILFHLYGNKINRIFFIFACSALSHGIAFTGSCWQPTMAKVWVYIVRVRALLQSVRFCIVGETTTFVERAVSSLKDLFVLVNLIILYDLDLEYIPKIDILSRFNGNMLYRAEIYESLV